MVEHTSIIVIKKITIKPRYTQINFYCASDSKFIQTTQLICNLVDKLVQYHPSPPFFFEWYKIWTIIYKTQLLFFKSVIIPSQQAYVSPVHKPG